MNMRLVKPEIAKRAGEEGKIYSFGKEIWRFILVFLIGSFIAGLIPAIYEMYLFLSDMEMFDQLQRLFLNGFIFLGYDGTGNQYDRRNVYTYIILYTDPDHFCSGLL